MYPGTPASSCDAPVPSSPRSINRDTWASSHAMRCRSWASTRYAPLGISRSCFSASSRLPVASRFQPIKQLTGASDPPSACLKSFDRCEVLCFSRCRGCAFLSPNSVGFFFM
ncbi:hypothetical protein EJ06DRAFT_78335 [Trichodelitschia bisporula]|uniref:Uncharacterized protein n=1 Tax=Trichodelitschia bisporula TaxID=703511 RepID=A0A6G1HTR0_9PEZI|nr:hypothetical protein EJ06DRAFT_78335 [Trichodelitschia bisporula]